MAACNFALHTRRTGTGTYSVPLLATCHVLEQTWDTMMELFVCRGFYSATLLPKSQNCKTLRYAQVEDEGLQALETLAAMFGPSASSKGVFRQRAKPTKL